MMSDRIFGLIILTIALAFIASATQIQVNFLSDPVGPKAFPILVASVAVICAISLIFRPDDEPEWPSIGTFMKIGLALVVLFGYAFLLEPLGFLIATALASGLLSYQMNPKAVPAIATGLGLSIGLFVIFKYILGLGLVATPVGWG